MAIDINIPSQVKTYANLAGFPATGSLKTIFIAEDTNKTYRWTGSAYVEISASQATAWGAITGTLSAQTDLQTALNAKQDSLGFTAVPTTRTLTINGTTQDLSADRTFTISTGITIGTTAITSGTVGRVLFEGTGNIVSESANLFWDNTNGRLGIGTSSPTVAVDVVGAGKFSLPIEVNSLYFGKGGTLSGTGNVAIGTQFSIASYSANNSTGVGVSALNATTGGNNTAFGYASLLRNSSGTFNVGVGGVSLQNTTTGGTNIGLGYNAGAVNSTGSSNIFIGNWSTGVDGTASNRTWIGNASTTSTYIAGNVLINTTTDAGFKLDVNGTARVSGAITLGTGTAVASSISYGATYGVTIYGNTGSNSDLLLTDRGGNLRFRIVNGGNILQTSSVINDISIGVGGVKSILADASYGMTVRGGVGSIFNLSFVENTGNNGIFIDSSGNAKIGVYNSTYNASAILEAVSTTKGFLPPRMTTTQKNAIATPATGLMVYDTTLNLISVYNGTTWITL